YRNEDFFTELESEGFDLFFIEFANTDDLHPGCSHCHNRPSFTDNLFHNNGLDSVASLEDFMDLGLGGVNGNIFDNGKFRSTTLRNIELTAPYMHDGRFNTLEEVVEHYAGGGHGVENENVNVTGFELTERKKQALVAFMRTLTDEEFINDPRFSNPFE
ncbi:MAG: cytochrome C peroxidase, partial [Bacteroidota bacterium]